MPWPYDPSARPLHPTENGRRKDDKKDKKEPPAWATRTPSKIKEILRQLSANAGQNFMPGAPVGAVRQGPFGSNMQPQKKFDPLTYGQTGGEATFFSQAMGGGMAPLAALMNLGVPNKWDPFNAHRGHGGGGGAGNGGGGGGGSGGGGHRSTNGAGNRYLDELALRGRYWLGPPVTKDGKGR